MTESRPIASSADPESLDRLLDRFDLAWQSGPPPAIEDFLPVGLAGRRLLLHELIKIDLEYRWRRTGQGSADPNAGGASPAGPHLEDYVRRLPRLGPLHKLPAELIGEEYRARRRWGDRPDHAEYARRFPRRWTALRAALPRIDAEMRDDLISVRVRAERQGADHFRCPHCLQVLKFAADLAPQELACPACGGAFSVEALSTVPGREGRPPSPRLGRYELGVLLGTGAFGSVWQARDAELGREVAVKLPRSGRFTGPAEEERFLREARCAARLHHPGVVAIYDVGRDQDTLYIVSELVRGESLAERLRKERLSFREAAELVAHAADALEYAHRQGVVHRDVKPSNILLGPDEPAGGGRRPRIMDFGLALRDAGEVTMTVDGQVLGTPAYMSPEQIRDPHAVDGRSDVYSLGVILYELLTGELPFRGMTRMLLAQVVSDAPRPPRRLNDRIPRDLETICLKSLAKERGRRYRTAAALAADLRRWLAGEPIAARPVGRLERLWLWVKRNRALVAVGGLGVAALAAVTGAPAAMALVAVAVGSLLFALHKAKAAAELSRTVEDVKATQKKTAAAMQFAYRHYSLAREERNRAVGAEARTTRRFARRASWRGP